MNENQVDTKKLLTKKDIRRTWMLWLGTCELSNSFERLQSLSFVGCLAPILKKLYGKDEDEMKSALERHMQFFNTEPSFGGPILAMTIAMEEERALGADINDQTINGLKTGLMGP